MSTYPIKLVRDKLEYAVGGGNIVYEEVDKDTHIRLLRRKLLEEAIEYMDDPSPSELADVMQVVRDLCVLDLKIELDGLEVIRAVKQGRRGGFNQGVVMSIEREE